MTPAPFIGHGLEMPRIRAAVSRVVNPALVEVRRDCTGHSMQLALPREQFRYVSGRENYAAHTILAEVGVSTSLVSRGS